MTTTTPETPGRHAVQGQQWPPTGADLLVEASRQATSAPRARDMSARRATLFALVGVEGDRRTELLQIAQEWVDRVHGSGSWTALTGADAAVPLAQCARCLQVAHERADCDGPIGGPAYNGQLTPEELLGLEAELAEIGGVR